MVLFAALMFLTATPASAYSDFCLGVASPDRAVFFAEMEEATPLQDDASSVHRAMRVAARATGCSFEQLNFAYPGSRCVSLPDGAASAVCYLESRSGYFTVQHDYLGVASVIFSRWD
jgi:hypothetical protein